MENSNIFRKQLAVDYAGNAESYEWFRRTVTASTSLYPHDFHFYNDSAFVRHERNLKELAKLKDLVITQKIDAKMTIYNTFNTFYPSYILHHHFDIFLPLLNSFKHHKQTSELLVQAQTLKIVGSYLQQKLRWDLKNGDKDIPEINQGTIHMDENTFFYSGPASPYIDVCAFEAIEKGQHKLVITRVRKQNGDFAEGVQAKDFGATISSDYLQLGYNFNRAKPLAILTLGKSHTQLLTELSLKQKYTEFYLSLKDLQKSLYITVKYTAMRRQFKTVDDSKEERRIITYQAVAGRIADGFALFLTLSDLNVRVVSGKKRYVLLAELLQSAHHTILQRLINLRECCGGFGYLQASGHPGCIERVALRASQRKDFSVPLTSEFLQFSQYYSSSVQSQKYYCNPIPRENASYMDYFGAFVSICSGMRRAKELGKIENQTYNREFVKQSAIQSMHIKEDFSKHDAENVRCLLLQYVVTDYVINNPKYLNWGLLQVDRPVFFSQIYDFKNSILRLVAKELEELGETLELDYLRNTIVGRADSEDFYRQVLDISRKNLRNSKEYVDYVKAPLVQLITENRARI